MSMDRLWPETTKKIDDQKTTQLEFSNRYFPIPVNGCSDQSVRRSSLPTKMFNHPRKVVIRTPEQDEVITLSLHGFRYACSSWFIVTEDHITHQCFLHGARQHLKVLAFKNKTGWDERRKIMEIMWDWGQTTMHSTKKILECIQHNGRAMGCLTRMQSSYFETW